MKSLLFSFLILITSPGFANTVFSFTPPVPLSEMEKSEEIVEVMNSVTQLDILETKTMRRRRRGQNFSSSDKVISKNFIDLATAFCVWVNNDPTLYIYGIICAAEGDLLQTSNAQSNFPPRIFTTTDDVTDNHGVAKDAVTDMKERIVTINTSRWQKENLQQRAMTTAMEMSLLIGIPERYLVAQRFINEVTHPKAKSTNECQQAMQILAKVMSAESDMIGSCRHLVESGQLNSQNYLDDKHFADHLERIFPFAVDYCDQACDHSPLCHGVSVIPGSTCREKY